MLASPLEEERRKERVSGLDPSRPVEKRRRETSEKGRSCLHHVSNVSSANDSHEPRVGVDGVWWREGRRSEEGSAKDSMRILARSSIQDSRLTEVISSLRVSSNSVTISDGSDVH